MTTVILGPRPAQVDALIAERHALGLDRHDEIWEGDYHMVPFAHVRHAIIESSLAEALRPWCRARDLTYTGSFNLGSDGESFRVPDFGVHSARPDALFVPTALLVGEILSPGDETVAKIPFYRARGVEELLVADPDRRACEVHHLGSHGASDRSEVLDLDMATLITWIDWD